MKRKLFNALFLMISLSFLCLDGVVAKAHPKCGSQENQVWKNDLPPRLQWNENFGYCGEVSLISAGLYYGQYISQYTARSVASQNTPQNLQKSQLMLGKNDQYAAAHMHLQASEWNTANEKKTPQFLAWVKAHVLKGHPVAIGVYTNEYLFYGKMHPRAGDSEFDHIVPVFGIGSHHPFTQSGYYADDVIYFSDNGLWDPGASPQYLFSYPFALFQASRKQANAKHGEIYSLANDGSNYGIAITGVIDLNGDTLPVRLATSVNDEKPEIKEGTSIQPASTALTLIITVSDLEPHVTYNLYRYNDLNAVPHAFFNAQAEKAYEHWVIQIETGTTFVMTENIQSDEIAVYRAVKANAL